MLNLERLQVKIFADGAAKKEILAIYNDPKIKGFTTNPTLLGKAGVTDYEVFAKELLTHVKDKPISFEILADDFPTMQRQAMRISSWGDNVYVKIPITNTKQESSVDLIKELAQAGVKQNITALMTLEQAQLALEALVAGPPAFISIFAGRIADTGRDPLPLMAKAVKLLEPYPNIELIWASSRELLNVLQANEIGCPIITVPHNIIDKFKGVGKDLTLLSLETIQQFYQDAKLVGLTL